MTNIWILKKRRRRLSQMIREARAQRNNPRYIEDLEDNRNNLSRKIKELRRKKPKT